MQQKQDSSPQYQQIHDVRQYSEKDFHKLSRYQQFEKRSKHQQMIQDHHNNSEFKNMLTPANPIINKNKLPDEQINFKLLDSERDSIHKSISHSLRKSKKIQQSIQRPLQIMTLFNGYDLVNMLFRKFDNAQINQLNKKKYFSSIFFPIFLRKNNKFQLSVALPPYEGMKRNITNYNSQLKCIQQSPSLILDLQQQLQFSSNFQSGNLFAVFKVSKNFIFYFQTGNFTYDLILQNDMNTTGCTQWFWFKVNNKKNKDIIVKFNIVNLYKGSSLYNIGMKPMVFSAKSSKGWKRKGQNIFYQKNCIKRQSSNNKYYSSLSFSYDFTKQNDTVEFAHAIPYTYARLVELLKQFQTSKKCTVKSLGQTPLKKTIPIVKFQSEDFRIQKRSIIIMARQHPGQVQGSFVIEEILLNLLKPSFPITVQIIEFLLWRFNFYIIPMVNPDGVYLGNYRCNAMGQDLNRNWEGQQKSKHPEIVYIKQEVKRIQSKYPIELIIDLHGHSNKMNSFFYGNPFGPNPYVFPYIASKTSSYIAFEECTFTLERKEKSKTARSVLGNLIKQTGNVYTYQMSFYGGISNKGNSNGRTIKPVNFYQESYKDLGKDLLQSMYKVFVEVYKEEKTLKESIYLKEIRKEIGKMQNQLNKNKQTGSDSEAQDDREQTEAEWKEQMQEKLKRLRDLERQRESSLNSYDILNFRHSQDLNSDDSLMMKIQSYSDRSNNVDTKDLIMERIKRNNSINIKKSIDMSIFNYDQSLQEKVKKHKEYAEKLKIYGQNVLSKPIPSINLSQQYQYHTLQSSPKAIRVSSIFEDRRRQASNINFSYLPKKSKNRNLNFSTLMSPLQQQLSDQSLINDIVRVNRLQYKKIQRQKHKYAGKSNNKNERSNSKRNGVFKLPSIINDFNIKY